MAKQKDLEFIKESGQEMYFDKEVAERMIERENNSSHILTSKIFEAILMVEFGGKRDLRIADLGAGAHAMRYDRFIKFLKNNDGKIYWVDQSPFMLDYALRNIPLESKYVFEFVKGEMISFLKKKKQEFDGLILKYSFNYLAPCSLEDCLGVIYKSLKKSGKVIANPHFYEQGMEDRSYNAIYKIKGKRIVEGYRPKDNEIIQVCFLEKPGDESVFPETLACTKTIYYSPEYIKEVGQRVGFSRIETYENWEQNRKWKESFGRLNLDSKSKAKSFLFLQK